LEFLAEYGIFLAKTLTILFSLLVFVLVVVSAGQKHRKADKGYVEVTHLNQHLEEITSALKQVVLEPEDFKKELKAQKSEKKAARTKKKKASEEESAEQSRVFVLDFDGDIKASQVSALREEVTAILSIANEKDAVVVRLESPGGLVHAYGLAASQLKRIVDRNIDLTVAVDKVAASGGYMMACVANRIIAAPFALLGSIGVVAQIPNFHRLLKKNDIDVEVLTAGEYKRTLTLFGENTDKDRQKFLEDMEDVHTLFKQFVSENRPAVNIAEVATGEAWYGTRALAHQLVDELKTSDELISEFCQSARVFNVKYVIHKKGLDKIMEKVASIYHKGFPGAQDVVPEKHF